MMTATKTKPKTPPMLPAIDERTTTPATILDRVFAAEGPEAITALTATRDSLARWLRRESTRQTAPTWTSDTRRLLTAIFEADSRLSALRTLIDSRTPQSTDNEAPGEASLLRIFFQEVGSDSVDRLISAGNRAADKAFDDLRTLRDRRASKFREYPGSAKSRGGWDHIETEIADLDGEEPALVARLARLEPIRDKFPAALGRRVSIAILDVGGPLVLAEALVALDGLANEPQRPPAFDRQIRDLEAAIEVEREKLSAFKPALTKDEYARLEEEKLRPGREALAAHQRHLDERRQAGVARTQADAAEQLLPTLLAATDGDPSVWARLAHAAQSAPDAFPVGFFAKWVQAAADAAIEVDFGVFLDKA